MDSEKSDGIEFHLGIALREISDELGIRTYVLKELRDSKKIVDGDEKDILNGKKELYISENEFKEIVWNAINKYVSNMRQGHVPQKYAGSLTKREERKDIQSKKVEQVSQFRKDKKLMNEILATAYGLSKFPLVNENKFSKQLSDNVKYICKAIISKQQCPNIYIFNRNMDAFMVVMDEDKRVFEFCKCILLMNKPSRRLFLNENILSTFGEIPNSLNNKYLFLWLKIRTEYYTDVLSKQRKKTIDNNTENSIKDKLIEEALKELYKRADKFPALYSIMPIWMVLLTKILMDVNDINLLIGFLCCNSASRELLLAKARELVEKEKSNSPQTTD